MLYGFQLISIDYLWISTDYPSIYMAVRVFILPHDSNLHIFRGYENQGRFSYPGESMKIDLGFHTLGRQSWYNNSTIFPRRLKVSSFQNFFIHFSYPGRSLSQSCLSGNLTSKFSYPFFLLVFIPGFHTPGKYVIHSP